MCVVNVHGWSFCGGPPKKRFVFMHSHALDFRTRQCYLPGPNTLVTQLTFASQPDQRAPRKAFRHSRKPHARPFLNILQPGLSGELLPPDRLQELSRITDRAFGGPERVTGSRQSWFGVCCEAAGKFQQALTSMQPFREDKGLQVFLKCDGMTLHLRWRCCETFCPSCRSRMQSLWYRHLPQFTGLPLLC